MLDWAPYTGGTVVGDVRVLRGAFDRELYAYLPPSHGEAGRTFPVVYMHDAQNVFDERTSNFGAEWRVDETMEELARDGIEAIVVAIPYAPGLMRGHEYVGDRARDYLRFIVEDVRAAVDSSFATDPRREATGVAGSSLGGVASLHALFRHPDVFGFAGVFSPAFWRNGDDRWFELVESAPFPGGRIYIDVGDDEVDERTRQLYLRDFERMTELLRSRGYDETTMRAVLERGGAHHESAWARRFPDAMRFLLAR